MPQIPDFQSAQTQSVQPDAQVTGGAQASSFGGGIGTALEGLGDAATRAVNAAKDLYDKDQYNLDRFEKAKSLSDFSGQEAEKLEQAKQGLGSGGKGFQKTFLTGSADDQPASGTAGVTGAGGTAAADASDDEEDDTPSPAKGNAADQNAAKVGSDGGFDGRAKAWLDENYGEGTDPDERAKGEAQVAALRNSLSGSALSAEFTERHRFYGAEIANQLDKLKVGVDQSPASIDAYTKQGMDFIDASGLSEADKEARKTIWKSDATQAYAQAQARNNPTAVAAQLGSTSQGYYAKLIGAESGGRNIPNAAGTSSASGPGQFLDGTWKGVVNSSEGKAAGLTIAGKSDPAQQQTGLRIFTAMNGAQLQKAGIEPNEANLRMAHFLGAPGFTKFNAAMQSNPGAIASAVMPVEAAANHDVFYKDKSDANPRSLQEVFALETKGFNGGSNTIPTTPDPHLQNLNYDQRAQTLGYAERQAAQQTAQATASAQAAQSNWLNDFQLKLHDGSLGQADIDTARRNGQITQLSDVQSSEGIVAKREKGVSDLANYGKMVGSGTPFNQADSEHKNYADAAFKAYGGDMAAAQQVQKQSGIFPDGGATLLKGALMSNDPHKYGAAANMASNMMNTPGGSNVFAGVSGQDTLEKAGSAFDHYVGGGSKTLDEFSKEAVQRNAPGYDQKIKINDADAKSFQDDLRKGDPIGDVQKSLSGSAIGRFFTGSVKMGVGDGQKQAVGQDYAELASDYYKETGDKDGAKAYALQQIHKLYGVSNGALMKFPPEQVYPDAGTQGKSYIYTQAAEAIKQANGETVDPKNVYLMPLPTMTAQAWRNKQPTPYAIHYIGEKDGVPTHGTVLSPGSAFARGWVPDPAKAIAAAQVKDGETFQQGNDMKQRLEERSQQFFSGDRPVPSPQRTLE